MMLTKRILIRLFETTQASDCVCQGWNPWHHPFTKHSAWCVKYLEEPFWRRKLNRWYNKHGGFYADK